MTDEQNDDDDGECDITPSTELLFSWRSQNLKRSHVLSELIDNSFDWGSTRVEIDITAKDIVVDDDGDGCDDLQGMLTAGKSTKGGKPRVGRFGVGLKDSAIWLGGTTLIRSVHHGTVRTVVANWDKIAMSHRWKIPKPRKQQAESGDRGTRLTFVNVTREMPSGKNLDSLIDEIGYLFSPALKNHKQIVFRYKNKAVVYAKRFELPRLEHEIDCDVIVAGKRAHVHVGIVPESDPNPRPGISYTHLHRVITPACGLGCGGRNYSRISGWVSLDGEWKLNKNKDGVNVDEDALGDAVYGAIHEVVDRAAKQSMSIKSAALAQNLTTLLRGMISEGTAVREPGEKPGKPGTVKPTGTGGRHKNCSKSRSGISHRALDAGRISIDFKPCEEPNIGSVDLRGPTIWLADNHPWITRLRASDNVDALLGEAMGLLANASRDPGSQTSFRWGRDPGEMSYELALGMLLRDQKADELKVVA